MATLTIEVPAELETRLAQEATEQGLALADCARILLASRGSSPGEDLTSGQTELTLLQAPLYEAQGAAVRIGQTRVSPDTVIGAYRSGHSAEGISECYPTVGLADIHAVIASYLRDPDPVDAYLERRSREAAEHRRKAEERWPSGGVHERLLSPRPAEP